MLFRSIVRIDSEVLPSLKKCKDIVLEKYSKPEDYEDKLKGLNKSLKNIKGEILFITCGSGSVSLASLKVLEILKDKCKINILYIRPDIEFLGAEAKMKERLVFNVFQEYARSGLFNRLYLVSNVMVEKALGGLSIISYFDKINDAIVSTFHMINSFSRMKAVNSTFSELPIGTRISTFGLVDVRTSEEKMFFDLDTPTDSIYYFAYSESSLKEDNNLLTNVKNMVRNRLQSGINRVSYGIYATSYETNFIVCANHTSIIQTEV